MLNLSEENIDLIGSFPITTEFEIVTARQSVRQFAKDSRLGIVDQTRITTAVSELFRNMYNYAGGGIVEVHKGIYEGKYSLIITCIDEGPGIENIEQAMSDGYTSGMGMGYGLPGTKRLVDNFEIESEVNVGTKVRIIKWI